MKFTNHAQRDLVTHLHGGVTQELSDGYPAYIFGEGESKTYTYSNIQKAATLWYHDHSHGETARTLYAGLAGMYILRDPDEDALGLPQGEFDVPLMIQDRSFNSDGSLRYQLDLDLGFRGDTILVNGAIAPRMTVKRRLYRFRFLNASNARAYNLTLGNNRPMTLIGTDGGLLPRPVTVSSIPIEPAMRRDVIIDFRKFGVGSKILLTNAGGEASTTSVMRFDVVHGGAEEASVPAVLSDEEELPPVNAERKWALTFQGLGLNQWQISGQGFDYNRIDCYPRQGSSELWTFHNYSDRVHPMHLHLAHFKVVTVNGVAPDEVLARGMHDTVRVGPQQEVVIRPWFDYYNGLYVFHCHASEHGDMSMMGQMQVEA
jgi:spore coat protein A, manganese oxidase